MFTGLLVIIYLSFISLGLPDTLLGAAWPVISVDFSAPLSYAGAFAMITAAGTIVSSLFSAKMIGRFGTGMVTAFSVLLTAAALAGFALAPGVWWFCLLAVPLGIGAGSVDAGLNNFVALHYKAMHMNWLHCFWGVGATAGPIIMSFFIAKQGGWRWGFGTVSLIQFALVAVLLLSLPLWRKTETASAENQQKHEPIKLRQTIQIAGAKSVFLVFFAYCALEVTTGLWGSSYLVKIKGLSADTAAQWVALYYLGITIGRFVSGFISIKLTNRAMIRMGVTVIGLGLVLLFLPVDGIALQVGFWLIGLGCAPIFPALLHDTPNRFGQAASQSVMGMQMASAYVGTTFMPPLFGVVAQQWSLALFPFFLLALWVLMVMLSENANRLGKTSV